MSDNNEKKMMARETLTGSRIRERRTMVGMKQADLARRADISPSYLNLIEHNRRRIGGKILLDIAEALGVEPALLTEGAEATLIAALREAAAGRETPAELDRVEEFAGRFPGWARLLADSHARVTALESTVRTLSDRLTHDPHLAASLHEMLTMVTAIRSTASILAEPGGVEPEWQARFHRNINEDSARLAETSQALVAYLDNLDDASASATSPQEEVDAVLESLGYHIGGLETGEETPEQALDRLAGDVTVAAWRILRDVLARYAQDARQLPLDRLEQAIGLHGINPSALAFELECDPALVIRRLACLPETETRPRLGLAICDGAGAMIFRKPVEGLPLPRLGAACPLLPLYTALQRPGVMLSELLEQSSRETAEFISYAYAAPVGPAPVNRAPLYNSHMLIVPVAVERPALPVAQIGISCRICPRGACPGRREPSILD